MEKFRIVEKMGKFTIQKKIKTRIGVFRRRKREEWTSVDINGFEMISYRWQIPLNALWTLEDAKKAVESIRKGTIYHEC